MSSFFRGAVYMNEPWLSIRLDQEHRCIYAEFKGFTNSVEFRQGTVQMLEAIQDRGVESLVSDNRRLKLVTSTDQAWIREVWTPLAVDAGLKRIAVVAARSGLGRYASNEIISQFPTGLFTTRSFVTPEQALAWVGGEPSAEIKLDPVQLNVFALLRP
jgi:hypothetical protein